MSAQPDAAEVPFPSVPVCSTLAKARQGKTVDSHLSSNSFHIFVIL